MDLDLSELRQIRSIYNREEYKEKLRTSLFHYDVQDQQGLGEMFIEYARLSADYVSTFDHMINNNLGIKEPNVHSFFFTKFKESHPRKALQCIQIAKQYCSNLQSIDSMSRELEKNLQNSLEQEYEQRCLSRDEIEEKLRSFEQQVYQSKNKRIKIVIDEQFRTVDVKQMINELEKLQAENDPYTQLNPEELDYDFKLIKPSFPQKRLQIVPQSPNYSNDIAISEEINKMTPVSTSSQSNHLLHLMNANGKSSKKYQKQIIPIPTVNQQNSPLKSLNRMKYRSIQKLRELVLTEKPECTPPDPLKNESPE